MPAATSASCTVTRMPGRDDHVDRVELRQQARFPVTEGLRERLFQHPGDVGIRVVGQQAIARSARLRQERQQRAERAVPQDALEHRGDECVAQLLADQVGHGIGAPDELQQRGVAIPAGHPDAIAQPVAQQPAGLRDDHRVLGVRRDFVEQVEPARVVLEFEEDARRRAARSRRPARAAP